MPEQAVCGWVNIHKMLPTHPTTGKPLMSLRSLQDRGPELKARGVIWRFVSGCGSNRHVHVCCFPSHFRAYIMEMAQEGKRF